MVTCCLVCSKSRLALLQAVSIPQLELMPAVVGLRFAETVESVLNISNSEWMFWSDSMDVIYWIRGRCCKFKPFVTNCAGEILLLTNPNQRRHLPTKQYPADFLTQGSSIASLRDEEKWWNFLTNCQLSSSHHLGGPLMPNELVTSKMHFIRTANKKPFMKRCMPQIRKELTWAI